jgi:hypothetical protein
MLQNVGYGKTLDIAKVRYYRMLDIAKYWMLSKCWKSQNVGGHKMLNVVNVE